MPKNDEAELVRIRAKVAAARVQSHALYIELCCENAECTARAVDVFVKDHFDTLVAAVERVPRCPLCGGRLVLGDKGVRPMHVEQARRDQQARERVNRQMLERDGAAVDGNRRRALSLRELSDDRLPPTPEGWFRRDDTAAG